jgi:hypothetical protein
MTPRLGELALLPWPTKAGHRIDLCTQAISGIRRSLESLTTQHLGRSYYAVRAILFDKRRDANWALGWHQDRTIAVANKLPVDGYKNWNLKDGVVHCEPPPEILERMVTARIHLDGVDASNGPLEILYGAPVDGILSVSEIANLADKRTVLTCNAAPGDVWLYPTLVVHRSGTSTSEGPRRVLQVDLSPDVELPGGVRWASERPVAA